MLLFLSGTGMGTHIPIEYEFRNIFKMTFTQTICQLMTSQKGSDVL